MLSLTLSLTVAAALLPVQPQIFKASIFIRQHDGDRRLRVVHVERATSGDEFDKTRGAVVVANVERKRQAAVSLRCLADVSNNVQSTEVVNTSSAPFLIMGKTPQQMIAEKNSQSQDFYGKVIDQDGQPIPDVGVSATLIIETDEGFNTEPHSTKTDLDGLFEFTGLHGASLGVTISKPGYENEWRNDPYKNPDNGRSSPTDRVIYKMWSTDIHEQLISGNKSFEIQPDGKPHFISLTDGTISDQQSGDLKVWIQYTNQPVRGQLYDWSAGIEVLNGGLFEVPQAAMNSGFIDQFTMPMYVAPTEGYIPSFQHGGQIKGGQSGEIGDRYFYLLINNGKEYGRMHINLFAPYGRLHPGLIRLSYAINPSGSRILR